MTYLAVYHVFPNRGDRNFSEVLQSPARHVQDGDNASHNFWIGAQTRVTDHEESLHKGQEVELVRIWIREAEEETSVAVRSQLFQRTKFTGRTDELIVR